MAIEETDVLEANQKGMSVMATQTRPRVQVDFTQESYQRLQHIREMAQLKTNVDTIRNALRLYAWYLEKRGEDFHLLLAKDNVVKEVELLL